MTREQIKDIQVKIGTNPDGIWGPRSSSACKSYLRSLFPDPYPWPSSDDESLERFYGESGDESNLVSMHVGSFCMKYGGTPISRIRCHKKVAESLGRILTKIAQSPFAYVINEYDGCFNDRNMRGGSRKSKHSWGIAIDFMEGKNGLHTPWPASASMPFEVMEIFAREGWTNLGWDVGKDAMHFQACG